MGERVKGSAFVGVGYSAPPMSFNLAGVQAINNASLDTLGYPPFGYWYFMNEEDVAPIMDDHVRILPGIAPRSHKTDSCISSTQPTH